MLERVVVGRIRWLCCCSGGYVFIYIIILQARDFFLSTSIKKFWIFGFVSYLCGR